MGNTNESQNFAGNPDSVWKISILADYPGFHGQAPEITNIEGTSDHVFYEPHIAGKIVMLARSTTKVVAILRCRGARYSERMIFPQSFRAMVLQMNYGIELVVKRPTIHCLARLYSIYKTQCAAVWDLIRGSLMRGIVTKLSPICQELLLEQGT